MIPNENFIKYFDDVESPECSIGQSRSSCLRIGGFLIVKKLLRAITFRGRSKSTLVSDFLVSVTDDQRIGFINRWNSERDHREKIYISYDSTSKNSQARDIELVEYGHPKNDMGLPVFNYSIAYDTENKELLFYEQYPGSIVDISQLQYMLEKAKGHGHKRAGFILDRGYFSRENIQYMDKCGYNFVIMVKGMGTFVKELRDGKIGKNLDYMTVPAAIRELEKIEIVR